MSRITKRAKTATDQMLPLRKNNTNGMIKSNRAKVMIFGRFITLYIMFLLKKVTLTNMAKHSTKKLTTSF